MKQRWHQGDCHEDSFIVCILIVWSSRCGTAAPVCFRQASCALVLQGTGQNNADTYGTFTPCPVACGQKLAVEGLLSGAVAVLIYSDTFFSSFQACHMCSVLQVEDNIGGPARQNSNGTTIGQLLAAGPQSVLTTAGQGVEPEGAPGALSVQLYRNCSAREYQYFVGNLEEVRRSGLAVLKGRPMLQVPWPAMRGWSSREKLGCWRHRHRTAQPAEPRRTQQGASRRPRRPRPQPRLPSWALCWPAWCRPRL